MTSVSRYPLSTLSLPSLYPLSTLSQPSHNPHTKDGATILVKLHQFAEDDTEQKVINTKSEAFRPGLVQGLSVLPLHTASNESVALVRWAPGTRFNAHQHWGGEEIFVIEGTFSDEYGDYPAGTWIRSPHLSQHTPYSVEGCLIYMKTGHLLFEGLSPLPSTSASLT